MSCEEGEGILQGPPALVGGRNLAAPHPSPCDLTLRTPECDLIWKIGHMLLIKVSGGSGDRHGESPTWGLGPGEEKNRQRRRRPLAAEAEAARGGGISSGWRLGNCRKDPPRRPAGGRFTSRTGRQ